MLRWAASHIRRKRSAQLGVVALVLLAAAVVSLLVAPLDMHWRAIGIVATGLAALAVGGAYLGYRTLTFARTLTAENVRLRQKLDETVGQVSRLQQDARDERLEQASRARTLSARMDRAMEAQAVDLASVARETARTTEIALNEIRSRLRSTEAAIGGNAGGSTLAQIEGELRKLALEMQTADEGAARKLSALNANLEIRAAATEQRVNALEAMAVESGGRIATILASLDGLKADLARTSGVIQAEIARKLDAVESQVKAGDARTAVRLNSADLRVADLAVLAQEATAETAAALARLQSQVNHVSETLGSSDAMHDLRFAELATLAQEVTEETSRGLVELGGRVAALETVSTSKADRAVVSALEQKFLASDANARHRATDSDARISELAKISEEAAAETARALAEISGQIGVTREALAKKADAKAVTAIDGDITQLKTRATADAARISELAKAADQAATEAGRTLADISGRIEAIREAVAKKADAKSIVDIESEIAKAKTRSVETDARVSQVAATLVNASADSRRALEEMGAQLGALADNLATKADQKLLAETQSALAVLTAEIEAKANKGSTRLGELERLVAAVDGRTLDVAARAQENFVEAARALAEIGARLKALEGAVTTKADNDLLAAMADDLSELSDVLETAANTGAEEIGTIQQALTDLRVRVEATDARLSDKAEETDLSAFKSALTEVARLAQETAQASSRAIKSSNQDLLDLQARIEAAETAGAEEVGGLAKRIATLEAGDMAALRQLRSDISGLVGRAEALETRATSLADEAGKRLASLSAAIAEAERAIAGKAGNGDMAALDQRLAQVLDEIRTVGANAVAGVDAHVKGIDARLATELASVQGRLAGLHDTLMAKADAQTLSILGAQIADVASLSEQVTRQAFEEIESVKRGVAEGLAAAKAVSDQLAAMSTRHAALARAFEAAESAGVEEVQELRDRLGEIAQQVEAVEGPGQRLLPEQVKVLESEWAGRLSAPVTASELVYAGARAAEIERRLDGRLGAGIADVVLRSLIARTTEGDSIDLLETGGLFGVEAAIMFDALKNRYETVRLTLVDPLDGRHGDGQPDPVTGEAPSERIVRANLAYVGAGEEQVSLIRRRSMDPRAVADAARREYDLLVIGADRSYAGVKADFTNYAPLVRLGGYIVFDGYGDGADVKAFVDTELANSGLVAQVGIGWGDAVFRVIRRAAPRRPAGGGAAKSNRKPTGKTDTRIARRPTRKAKSATKRRR